MEHKLAVHDAQRLRNLLHTSLHAFAIPKKGYHIQSQGELYRGVTTDLT